MSLHNIKLLSQEQKRQLKNGLILASVPQYLWAVIYLSLSIVHTFLIESLLQRGYHNKTRANSATKELSPQLSNRNLKMTKVMGRKLEKVQWISETMHMTCFKMNAWSCYSPVFVNMVLATNQQKYAVVTFLICCADQLKTGMTKHTLIRKPY